jgi:hypothetical protein
MVPEAKKDTVLHEIYVKRYKDFIRLVRISKMLSKAKIISHTNQK